MHKNYIDQLRAIMVTAGWTQEKLAKKFGVTFPALNRWLNKRAIPHKTTQRKIFSLYKEIVGFPPLPENEITFLLLQLDKERKKHKEIKSIIKGNKSLREDLLLELTYNSNAIEGSTLTRKETETIIFDKAQIHDKSYIEHLEATNHAAALNQIFEGEFEGSITETMIKKLHRIILQGISHDAGSYSKHHRAIRGVNLKLPGPEDIPEEMEGFIKHINKPKGHIVSHIAEMHAEFEAIHPFPDGNGRVGRLIMIIQLLNSGYPPCVVENSKKSEYYEFLEYAQKKDGAYLVKFIIGCIFRGYDIVRKHRK